MLTKDFKNEIALVTGATGGIGRATSHALAALGCSIAVHYHSAGEEAATLVQELQSKHHVQAKAFAADMSSYTEVRALHAAVEQALGAPTILFNNAGTTLGKTGVADVETVSIDEFEQTWRVNCGSAYLLAQLCMPAMAARAWGRVVFCSSAAAFTGGVVGPHYASSKSALHGLIHYLSQIYCHRGVTVNGVAPALIQGTKMLPAHMSSDELAKKIPLGRLGDPEDIAETIVWFVKSGYVTNKVIGVDGGLIPQ